MYDGIGTKRSHLALPKVPKYFFDLHNNFPSFDEIGQDLPNDEAAWREATTYAGEVLRDMDGKMRPGHEWALDVTDENRSLLFHIKIGTKKAE
jgi:hypothetical protein